MIVVAIIGFLAAVAVPNFLRMRERAQTSTCIANLKHIDDAKSLWAMDAGAQQTSEPSWADLVPDYFNRAPQCPAGGTYTLGIVSEYPLCSISGHELRE